MEGKQMTSVAPQQKVIRGLSSFETFFSAISMTVWASVRLRGELDRAALGEALQALGRAYPVLRQEIGLGEHGFVLVEGEREELPFFWEEAAEIEAPKLWAMPLGSGLAAVNVVSAEDERLVAFGVHHGVADARAAMYYHLELWSLYTQIVTTGSAPSPVPAPFPAAPEELLRERGVVERPMSGADRLEGSVWAGKAENVTGGMENREYHRIVLDTETTSGLRAASKARGMSLHGAVCGAIVAAERSLIAEPGPVAIGLRSSVDIRQRVVPPIGVVEGTNLVAMAYAQAVMDEVEDPFAIGSKVLGDLAEDLDDGLVQQQLYHAFADMLAVTAPSLYITNIGSFDMLTVPEGLVIEDIWGVVEVKPPEFGGSDGGPAPAAPFASTYVVSSFAGQFAVEANFPVGAFTAAEIAQLGETLAANLRAMAQAG